MAKVITGKVRLSYVHAFVPQANQNGGDPKYSVTCLIPKTDTNTVQAIKSAINQARQDFCAKNGAQALPATPKHTLYDGDGTRPSGDHFGEECKGCYVITVSSKDKPLVIGRDGLEIMDATEVYSGCYARVIMNFFGYNSNGNKGISAALQGIQKWADGEPLGGARVTADDFNDGFDDGEAGDDWL